MHRSQTKHSSNLPLSNALFDGQSQMQQNADNRCEIAPTGSRLNFSSHANVSCYLLAARALHQQTHPNTDHKAKTPKHPTTANCVMSYANALYGKLPTFCGTLWYVQYCLQAQPAKNTNNVQIKKLITTKIFTTREPPRRWIPSPPCVWT